MTLADQIDHAIIELQKLFFRAWEEFERDGFPEEWNDDLDNANEAAQEAAGNLEVGDFDERANTVYTMLRRIDKFDDEQVA